MWKERKYYVLLLGAVCWIQLLSAQEPAVGNEQSNVTTPVDQTIAAATVPAGSLFTIRSIIISGNRKTRPEIILREIPFKVGNQFQLNTLVKKFEDARRLLMNTALFHDAIVALKAFEGYQVDVIVNVKERWYLFPLPYLRPVDRNLNQWLVEQNAKLSRVNYGLKLLWNNVTGRNDKLRLWVIGGYTKQISFNYNRLYIDRKMKWGINLRFTIGKNREVNYNTVDDKQVFLKDNDNYIRRFASTYAEITYRRAIKTRHYLGIGFTQEDVSDTIVALNPKYFISGNRLKFPEIYYKLTYFDLDYNPYPTKGYAGEFMIGKKGFNHKINLWDLSLKGSGSWPFSKKSFLNLNVYGDIKWPFRQPYFHRRFLGYNDAYLQGYEYYVIDGVAGGYIKVTTARELFNFYIKSPPARGSFANGIPVRIFGKLFGNTGYVYNPEPGNNSLSNRMLSSAGVGIDIITAYDFVLKLEWTFNQLGQNGLFLHKRSNF